MSRSSTSALRFFCYCQTEGSILLPHGGRLTAAMDTHLPRGRGSSHWRWLIPWRGHRGRTGTVAVSSVPPVPSPWWHQSVFHLFRDLGDLGGDGRAHTRTWKGSRIVTYRCRCSKLVTFFQVLRVGERPGLRGGSWLYPCVGATTEVGWSNSQPR